MAANPETHVADVTECAGGHASRRSSPTLTTASMCPTRRVFTRASSCSSSGSTCGHASGCSPASSPTFRRTGDYSTFEIGAEQIILVRQADASIKAFYNVCPHRGNRIALNDRGSVAQFTCAFHGWQFHMQRPA